MINSETPKSRVAVSRCLMAIAAVIFLAFTSSAQVPSPKSVLGFNPTDDRTIADWKQITDYFARLDAKSNRVLVREIDKSTLGRPLIVAFISSPQNLARLDQLREINARLAHYPSPKTSAEVERLIKAGKTVVAISCSIHSTEIVASQMSMNLAYELATATDAGTLEILDNTVLMLIPSPNPDGIDIVADWYRKTLGTKYEGTSPPELYHHYAGHDDNRDWFMMNLRETRAVTKLFWQEWFPQIVYDIHQQGQFSSRFTIPPFFDPINPRIAPSIVRETGLIGYKMAADIQAQNIAGVATNSAYDSWWHGGFRSAPYYHNSIGILSEAASANLMSPLKVTEEDLKKARGTRGLSNLLEPATNFPDVWKGGEWRPADIARMEMIASRSLLEMAAKFRPRYLRNFYNLGTNNFVGRGDEPVGFVIAGGQPGAINVSRMIEILMWQGVEIYQMTEEGYFAHDPKQPNNYHEMPLGSFFVYVNQAQKNNVMSLFERQVYPNRLLPNGDAEAPYDVAGWTLPLQMGVETDTVWRVRDMPALRKTLRKVENINQARKVLNLPDAPNSFAKQPNPLKTAPRVGLYKGFTSSMDEGWTRFVFDEFNIPFKSVSDSDMRDGKLDLDVIVLPADSENVILRGLSPERYPAEFTGGIGEAGLTNLRKFVENGGRLICFDDSCEMVIKAFGLPVKNVLQGLRRNEFYNPGSVVKIILDKQNPRTYGMNPEAGAYFSSSSAFEIKDSSKVREIAKYAEKDALMSGWMLGEKYLNGKTALAEAEYGKGRITLFAFRPQHRGQSWGTFPLIFNSLEK